MINLQNIEHYIYNNINNKISIIYNNTTRSKNRRGISFNILKQKLFAHLKNKTLFYC